MEYVWYIIAATGAGIGTGLAGLSAATVMVPILIVLCPSFSGETGAYQATAIALASDILGSAVTTWTYAKHKNIDLRRGWLMLVCILTMCTVGSYAAFLGMELKTAVGLVTGAVLTVLGGAMLLLNFWPQIREFPLAVQTLMCLMRMIVYIVPCVLILLPIRFLTKVPSFVFRKLLHIFAFTCFTVMMLAAECWQAAALTSVIIAVGIYPLLALIEKEAWYGRLFVQKSPGEVKRSLLMLFFMFAAVIAVSWGLFDNPHAAAASILMWGVGDASAALVGIPFGKHKIRMKFLSGKKSFEGSGAMLLASGLTGFMFLRLYGGYTAGTSLLASLVMAAAGTVVELVSPSEWDTVTVPAVMLAFALIILQSGG